MGFPQFVHLGTQLADFLGQVAQANLVQAVQGHLDGLHADFGVRVREQLLQLVEGVPRERRQPPDGGLDHLAAQVADAPAEVGRGQTAVGGPLRHPRRLGGRRDRLALRQGQGQRLVGVVVPATVCHGADTSLPGASP
jgi:hypothetical protein